MNSEMVKDSSPKKKRPHNSERFSLRSHFPQKSEGFNPPKNRIATVFVGFFQVPQTGVIVQEILKVVMQTKLGVTICRGEILHAQKPGGFVT